ncbi:hypothetical protein HDU87_003442 [Geranomyces variabilis]|uniref:FAS1 domain-containing protein n=1 Tax=Geranomyces variabilis TaxID=109894 RepID=A0AAD5XN42_9FUNG|nr:hypothetical protein HDU87_003442 [Geranomyces variabilis]
MRILFALVCLIQLLAVGASCFQHELDRRAGNTIIDQLRQDRRFTRLVEVLDNEPGLRDELDSDTASIFAPDNEAFEAWIQRGYDKRRLRDLLSYHIVPDIKLTADQLKDGALLKSTVRLPSLDNRHQRLRVFRLANGEVWLNMESRVIGPETPADNGVIFPVHRILNLPSMAAEMLATMPGRFSLWLLGLERTDMKQVIAQETGVTLFVPSNEAWEALGNENLKYLFSCVGQNIIPPCISDDCVGGRNARGSPDCKGRQDLTQIFKLHIARQVAFSSDMLAEKSLEMDTLAREKLAVRASKSDEDTVIIVNDKARVIFSDALSSEGPIQITNQILIPKNIGLPQDVEKRGGFER